MINTTIGQLMVNEALPEDMRDYNRVLDGDGVKKLFDQLARQHPDKYADVIKAVSDVGREAAYTTGGFSFGLKHMQTAKKGRLVRSQLEAKIDKIQASTLPPEQKEQQVLLAVDGAREDLEAGVYDETVAENNPLAEQLNSRARGNKGNLRSLRGADLLYQDHHDRLIPVPVLRSYSDGLLPEEYWAGTYGARKGVADTKMATADAGFFAKQLNQAGHRLVVTETDDDNEYDPQDIRGYPVDTDDEDNEGALLSQEVGGYARNTPLTPKILKDLRNRGHDKLLVRSPLVGGPESGGVYARDVGIRERGGLATRGDFVGMAAAQALSEKLTQGQLSSKHSGGVAGSTANQAVSGFKYINQLVQVPKAFKGGATHSEEDGRVTGITDAPQGGKYVMVGSKQHYVPGYLPVSVKAGQEIEAGDVLSEGTPNPSLIVKHKGIGEGRRYFVQAFRDAYKDSGMYGHRRNVELLARGLIDHVRLTDEVGDHVQDDIVPYSVLERNWKPRADASQADPRQAVGQYLDKPTLHYSIGTKIRKSMLPQFKQFGINTVTAHKEPPPFQPEMIRGMATLQHDPDWMTRHLGSNLQKSTLQAVHRGGSSDTAGTSYVPALAAGADFGRSGLTAPPPITGNTP
jgi:DNA-directed RNA polymerase subunit beta'